MIARVRIAAAANFYPSHSQVGISVHPRLIHGSLGQYLSPHFKRHLHRSSRFCRAHPFYPTPPEVFGTPVHCRAERWRTCPCSKLRRRNCCHSIMLQQVCIPLPTYADSVALPALTLPRRCCCCEPDSNRSVSRYLLPPGPQQQICSSGFAAMGPCWDTDRQTDRQTDGLTDTVYIDPAQHTTRSVPITGVTGHQSRINEY